MSRYQTTVAAARIVLQAKLLSADIDEINVLQILSYLWKASSVDRLRCDPRLSWRKSRAISVRCGKFFIPENRSTMCVSRFQRATRRSTSAFAFTERTRNPPRLTLSEGYRNSLGLCVFLAMAKREDDDRPLFLDDVVISLDRKHRGMVAEILEKKFAGRQVVLLTHDRVWYSDPRHQLAESRWYVPGFATLRSSRGGDQMVT